MLAVEKRTQSPLLDSDSIEKIMEIDSHVACAMSGLTADARTMVEHARVTAQVRRFCREGKLRADFECMTRTTPSRTTSRSVSSR